LPTDRWHPGKQSSTVKDEGSAKSKPYLHP
jgi:hypothetical protein